MAVTTVERISAWQRAYNIIGALEQAAHYAGDNSQHKVTNIASSSPPFNCLWDCHVHHAVASN